MERMVSAQHLRLAYSELHPLDQGSRWVVRLVVPFCLVVGQCFHPPDRWTRCVSIRVSLIRLRATDIL